jgi:uncharacterized protein (DUF427 family)
MLGVVPWTLIERSGPNEEEPVMTRPVLEPTKDHPITVEPAAGTVTVRVGDREIARTSGAVTLRESTYPPVQYIPLADVDPAVLRDSATTTYCPYKGDASYYSVDVGDSELTDVIWTYRDPRPAVASIRDKVAFYPDQVTIEVAS